MTGSEDHEVTFMCLGLLALKTQQQGNFASASCNEEHQSGSHLKISPEKMYVHTLFSGHTLIPKFGIKLGVRIRHAESHLYFP